MKCQNCEKKEATVSYKENINGKKQELYLCSECASKIGLIDFPIMFSPMITSLNNNYINEHKVIKCKNCNYTIDDYSKTGILGCPECYNTFERELDSIFLKFHGKNRHIKAIQKKESPVDKLKKNVINKNKNAILGQDINYLKEELKKLIEREEYEKAAIIRDKIKEIEKN